ncbi:MAG: type I restriction enzyme, S subunit [Candidatus Methanomarinus sp.]|nr:MAG: type I restriction enzyme, S subunit [ANME-2 cluster archaeon]
MMSESIRDGYKMTELGELPEEWKVTTIEKGCEILDNRRIPINSEERVKIKGNIPYYGANGVQDYINDYIFNEDLILLAEDGGYFDEFDNRPIAYTISGKSWVNNHAHILRVKNHMDNYFVFYNLVHKNILFYIKGGTRSKLNQSELKKIKFPFPPRTAPHRRNPLHHRRNHRAHRSTHREVPAHQGRAHERPAHPRD